LEELLDDLALSEEEAAEETSKGFDEASYDLKDFKFT
jgi:hypothetical protein